MKTLVLSDTYRLILENFWLAIYFMEKSELGNIIQNIIQNRGKLTPFFLF